MRASKLGLAIFAGLFVLSSPSVKAEPSRRSASVTRLSVRPHAAPKLGLGLGLFGDPAPALGTVSVRFRPLRSLMVSAGFGYVAAGVGMGATASANGRDLSLSGYSEVSFASYGAAVRWIQGRWKLSPSFGLGVTRVQFLKSGIFSDAKLFGKSESFTNLYASTGLDWQIGRAWSATGGINRSFDRELPWLPYVGLSFFFL